MQLRSSQVSPAQAASVGSAHARSLRVLSIGVSKTNAAVFPSLSV